MYFVSEEVLAVRSQMTIVKERQSQNSITNFSSVFVLLVLNLFFIEFVLISTELLIRLVLFIHTLILAF